MELKESLFKILERNTKAQRLQSEILNLMMNDNYKDRNNVVQSNYSLCSLSALC